MEGFIRNFETFFYFQDVNEGWNMGKIFIAVGLGVALGFFGVIRGRGLKWNGYMQTFWLMLLIFCMGVSIGRNKEVIDNLLILGGRALLFSILAIIGSVVVTYFVSRLFLGKEGSK